MIRGNRDLNCLRNRMKNLHNIEPLNWDLLAKYLCGEASESERQEIEAWTSQSGVHPAELNHNRILMEKSVLWYKTRRFDTEKAWQEVASRTGQHVPVVPLHTSSNHRIYRRLLRVAASVLLVVALGTAGYLAGFRQNNQPAYAEIIANERQILSGIVLPDGSVVTLNRNSTLTYPKTFTGNTREVIISGEAFFEVKPDASMPFIIHAGTADIRVLGTSFNVSAYPQNESVDIIVETGKVQVTCSAISENSECHMILEPGEKGTLSSRDYRLEKARNTDRNAIAWKTRQLVFEETPLNEVATTLEKVYQVNIRLADKNMEDLVLTANFLDQPVDFILDVIRLTFNLELTSLDEQYLLTRKVNK